MAVAVEYIECQECDFVLLSGTAATPEPKRVDACPGCGGTDFGFVDGESSTTR